MIMWLCPFFQLNVVNYTVVVIVLILNNIAFLEKKKNDFEDTDLKQMDCLIFLLQKWIYLGLAKNCNIGSATTASHMQVPAGQGKEEGGV